MASPRVCSALSSSHQNGSMPSPPSSCARRPPAARPRRLARRTPPSRAPNHRSPVAASTWTRSEWRMFALGGARSGRPPPATRKHACHPAGGVERTPSVWMPSTAYTRALGEASLARTTPWCHLTRCDVNCVIDSRRSSNTAIETNFVSPGVCTRSHDPASQRWRALGEYEGALSANLCDGPTLSMGVHWIVVCAQAWPWDSALRLGRLGCRAGCWMLRDDMPCRYRERKSSFGRSRFAVGTWLPCARHVIEIVICENY
mmetsp:Transcript_41157/g.113126  ORF Transcript_41157/g.113126 Transcript_41157/m.113126 type:complete len:259 (+) Transcript_41157:534-1310(+)